MSTLRSINRRTTKLSTGDKELAAHFEKRLATEVAKVRAELIAAIEQNSRAIGVYAERADAGLQSVRDDLGAAIETERKDRDAGIGAVIDSSMSDYTDLRRRIDRTLSYRLLRAWRAVLHFLRIR